MRDASPLGVGCEQRSHGAGVSSIQRLGCGAELVDHVIEYATRASVAITERRYVHLFDRQRTDEVVRQAMQSRDPALSVDAGICVVGEGGWRVAGSRLGSRPLWGCLSEWEDGGVFDLDCL